MRLMGPLMHLHSMCGRVGSTLDIPRFRRGLEVTCIAWVEGIVTDRAQAEHQSVQRDGRGGHQVQDGEAGLSQEDWGVS